MLLKESASFRGRVEQNLDLSQNWQYLYLVQHILLSGSAEENTGLGLSSPELYPWWLLQIRCMILSEPHHIPLPLCPVVITSHCCKML